MKKEYIPYNNMELSPLIDIDTALEELAVINEFETVKAEELEDDMLEVIYSL